jgi:hypothetical protein
MDLFTGFISLFSRKASEGQFMTKGTPIQYTYLKNV